ncbi:protein polyglycylase TTLL10-like [Littorina saxatilis]|uniref:protein polyglycylase TTLL10-like n=1 Tax=Littorina saxatilis TaxID=31220 RepID=UPI0038B6398C
MTPTFFIGGGNGVALVEGPLLAMGWKRITDKYDERYKLKWVECKSKINYSAFKEGDQIVNHIPNCKLLTNKLGLLCSLQEYERVTLSTKGRPPRLKMSDFFPETYKLDERNDRATFLDLYQDGEMWICKPVGMNQGKGIFLLRTREEIDNLLADRDAKKEVTKHFSRPPMVRIVQRYLTNPLLLEGRKFDIRAYMLVASTAPYLVLFHHGYIRLSCLKYNDNDTNLTTHLTNQFVQKKDPTYKDVKEDTTWTMAKFNDYINKHCAEEKGLEEDWTYNTLTKHMQRIMLHCFNSVKHKLQCKLGYFDLYGLDFMVDTDMKVWLIEINANPALHVNCEALKEVIPGVVEETIRVSIEAFEKNRRHQPLLPLQSMKGFQVLHCGTAAFNVAPRQTRSVSPAKGENPERSRQAQTAHANNRHFSPPRSLPRMSLSTTQKPPWSLPHELIEKLMFRVGLIKHKMEMDQVSPYAATLSQGGNAGGVRTSQTTLPIISHSNSSTSQSQSTKNTTPTTTSASASKSVTVVTIGNKTAPSSIRHSLSMTDVPKSGGEDVKLKMTHANSASSVRRNKDKPDRGN